VGLACVTGAGMHFLLFGIRPVFGMSAIPVPDTKALAIYVLLGAVVGVIATFVSRSVYWIEDLFDRLPIHWMWWPAIGAIAIGVVGYFEPKTMGVGYDNIRWLLKGSAPLAVIAMLGILKYVSWSISLGSGTSGGTLAPLFTIGGALGAVLGGLVLQMFPLSHINMATAALIGMAAMFAGASRAWLTSIVFALETTGQINGLLPLLGACLAAYFVSFFLMKGSIMTEKINRRGVKTPDTYEPDALRAVTVRELLRPADGAAIAVLPACNASDDAGLAAEMMGQYNTETVAVKDDLEDGKIIGVITARSILQYYSHQRQKEQDYQSPARTRRILAHGRRILKDVQKLRHE
ncbi:MAG TPA: chloride channel protein, partial [Puia sp.]|nr:chloride channel protein [Puia sp.]